MMKALYRLQQESFPVRRYCDPGILPDDDDRVAYNDGERGTYRRCQ
jgi:hypothetical protein